MNMKTKIISVLLFALVVIVAGWYVLQGSSEKATEESFDSGYDLVLTDYEGNEVHLSDYRRTALIVYTWASWCPYCSAELDQLTQIQKELGDEVAVVAVNRAESKRDAEAFTNSLAIDGITLLLDPQDTLYKDIEGYAMPEMLFINKKGDVVFHQHGPMEEEDIRAQLQAMLQK